MAVLSVGIAALGHELFYMPLVRSILSPGERSLQGTSAEALDRDIRAALPPGTSRVEVETLLRSRQVLYGYGSLYEIDALASGLTSSSPSVADNLTLRFYFDEHDELRSIVSHIVHTGRKRIVVE